MIRLLIIFIQKNWEDIGPGMVGVGSFTVMMTGLNLILKALVAAATLIFFAIRIYKEIKSK